MHPIFLHYPIDVPSKQIPNMPYDTFEDQTYYYFILPISETEKYVYEIYTISAHYRKRGWTQVTCPLFNIHNQFITTIENKKYILCYAQKNHSNELEGRMLSTFHRVGLDYPYQPSVITSYGRWQDLWITKIDQYEAYYHHLLQQRPMSSVVRKLLNILPYIIGMAENAIQYMHILHKEPRFNEQDRPTITFGRYDHQIAQDFVWSHHLVYDHPVRDLAEKLRPSMKRDNGLLTNEIQHFLQNYFETNPLSIFGWKLLYCRLLFPIHLLEYVDQVRMGVEIVEKQLTDVLQEQRNYEANLRSFFTQLGMDQTYLHHIQLDWLTE